MAKNKEEIKNQISKLSIEELSIVISESRKKARELVGYSIPYQIDLGILKRYKYKNGVNVGIDYVYDEEKFVVREKDLQIELNDTTYSILNKKLRIFTVHLITTIGFLIELYENNDLMLSKSNKYYLNKNDTAILNRKLIIIKKYYKDLAAAFKTKQLKKSLKIRLLNSLKEYQMYIKLLEKFIDKNNFKEKIIFNGIEFNINDYSTEIFMRGVKGQGITRYIEDKDSLRELINITKKPLFKIY